MKIGHSIQLSTPLKRIALIGLVIVLAVVANVAGRYVADSLQAKPKQAVAQETTSQVLSGLKVELAQLQLGEVWETPQYSTKVTLENVTKQSIIVKNFGVGCECMKVVPNSLTIAAGQQAEIELYLNLTHRSPHQYGVARRELSVDLVPNIEGKPTTSGAWRIQGTICCRVGLVDQYLQFGDVPIHGGQPVSKSVTCLIHDDGTRIEATLSPAIGKLSITKPSGTPLSSQITVTLNPNLPVGKVHFDLPLTVIRTTGEKERGPVLEVDGEMRSPFQVTPSQILLGEHPVGKTVEAEFAIRIPPKSDYTVHQVSSSDAATTVNLLSNLPNDEQGRVLTYSVTQEVLAGDKATEITILLRNTKGKSQKVSVRLASNGTDVSNQKSPSK